jgi:hypothetical protein
MTEAERTVWLRKIDEMSQMEMASLQRFAPAGHPIFDCSNNLSEYFKERFNKKGGMTPEISKELGWKK